MPAIEETLRGLDERRSSLQQDLEKVTSELRDQCVKARQQGMQKTKICELAGISRPTLDEWIAKA